MSLESSRSGGRVLLSSHFAVPFSWVSSSLVIGMRLCTWLHRSRMRLVMVAVALAGSPATSARRTMPKVSGTMLRGKYTSAVASVGRSTP